MIFDFKDQLSSTLWDKSGLVQVPPKTYSDYLSHLKFILKDNVSLLYPFLFGFCVITSLNYYSSRLQSNISALQDSHNDYQDMRSSIISAKRNIDTIDTFISSRTPFITDSIYPNLFLSFLSSIVTADSYLSSISLSKDSSSLIVVSPDIDFLSSSFSTLDQHPLVKSEDISFTSIKKSSDTQSGNRSSASISNEIEIKFSYNYVGIPLLSQLFGQSNSPALEAKSFLFE